MDWQEVASPEELDSLLGVFGGFHDSCLREVHLWTETWVDEEHRMACPGHLDTNVRMFFQRQAHGVAAIELWFSEVTAFHLIPSPEGYDSIIFDAALSKGDDGLIYWGDGGAEDSWVAAKRLRWRDVSDWMGDQLRYGPGEASQP